MNEDHKNNKTNTRSSKRKNEEKLKFNISKKKKHNDSDDDSEYFPEDDINSYEDDIEYEDNIDESEEDDASETLTESYDEEEEEEYYEEDEEYEDKENLVESILIKTLAKKLGDKILGNVFKKMKIDEENIDIEKNEESEEQNEEEIFNERVKDRCSYDNYFNTLNDEEQKNIFKIEDKIKNFYETIIPIRYKILKMNTSISNKSLILNKVETYETMSENDNEYHKLSKWINGISMIPFGKYINLKINKDSGFLKINSYLNNCYSILDREIYGQTNAKNKLMQILTQWISNPESQTTILALEGPPGIGKTSLIKGGVSKALERPFGFMALGGTNDSSIMEGHSYTYEGAVWGKIANILMQTQCMNPIIFFDELDKVSNTEKGKEIIGILTHLTDPVQNKSFTDKYFDGIELDLSKAFIVFSYNNPHLINPILKDRLTVIKFDTYKVNEKVIIAKKYVLPKLFKNVGIEEKDVIINEKQIKHIITKYASLEKGVRNLKRCLEDILMKINLIRFVKNDDNNLKSEIKFPYNINKIGFKFPLTLNNEIIDELLKTSFKKSELPMSIQKMYL